MTHDLGACTRAKPEEMLQHWASGIRNRERERLHGEMGIPSPGLEQEGKAEVSTKLSSIRL